MVSSKELINAFKKSCQRKTSRMFNAAFITAEMDGTARLANSERFQTQDDCQLIVCSMGKDAGHAPPIGLNMQAASSLVFFSISWQSGHSEQLEDRVLRIGSKNAVSIYYMPAAGTFEEEKLAKVEQKRIVCNAAMNGENNEATDADESTQLYFLRNLFD